jgi:NADPH:quinone reductase-like Zn-dependent oxidoreductase
MRTLRFHENGAPEDVLRLEDTESPLPGPGQVRIAVQACGLNPADWALCGGLFAGDLPRGVGLEVSGTVDALGEGVAGLTIGDPVFGPAPFAGPTAGASEQAVLDTWFPRPAALAPADAAALPMAVETAYRGLDALNVRDGVTLLINGAGTTVGYAAVQIALQRGAKVIATAGETYADALRAMGAQVTSYGDGMDDRVRAAMGGPVGLAFDVAPRSNALPLLVRTVARPEHVLTLTDVVSAKELGVRTGGPDDVGSENDTGPRTHVLGEYGQLAAEGRFTIPVARTYPLDDWRAAVARSQSGRAGGKLVLTIG